MAWYYCPRCNAAFQTTKEPNINERHYICGELATLHWDGENIETQENN